MIRNTPEAVRQEAPAADGQPEQQLVKGHRRSDVMSSALKFDPLDLCVILR